MVTLSRILLISSILPKTTIPVLKTMKLDSEQFHSLFTPELRQLASLFDRNGYEIRIAGGAVRDLLMGARPSDVDFATDATPTQMKEMFTREQVRMLHKRGEEHGTITCRINDRENFEVTTLRVDVVCDGRRAAVEFTKSWQLDAFRRDLTINSLFLGLDGVVHDYTGGVEDIKQRNIVFVGDPTQRLQEDYLRILRYFRFFGRFARTGSRHNPDCLDAIIRCRDGLKILSGERIWMELHRILVGRMAALVVRSMLVECELGPYLGVHSDRVDEFERIALANAPQGSEGPLSIEPSTALSSLFVSADDAHRFQLRCKCSNAEKWLCEMIVARREEAYQQRDNLDYFKHLILDEAFNRGADLKEVIRRECIELMKYVGASDNVRKTIEQWEMDQFPVGGLDLLPMKVPKGPRMRVTLRHLFNLWKQSDLTLTKDDLLKHIDDLEIGEMETASSEDIKKKRPKRKHSPIQLEKSLKA